MTVSRARGAKAKADKLFSLIVRSVGSCQACGENRYEQLQTAHIISRRYNNTRCDLDNAICLCASCHRHFTDHPVKFGEFVMRHRPNQYAALVVTSQKVAKVNWDDELVRLTAIWKEIEAAA